MGMARRITGGGWVRQLFTSYVEIDRKEYPNASIAFWFADISEKTTVASALH